MNEVLKELQDIAKIYKIEEGDSFIVLGCRLRNEKEKRKLLDLLSQKIQKEVKIFFTPYDEVKYVIETKISKYLKSHGGDVKLVKVDGERGEVIVSMEGACSLCPSAVATMKAGIRRILSQYLDWVKKVEPAEEPKEPDFGFKLAPRIQK